MSWDNVLFFPGVITHEISHLLACILTKTKVTGVKLWGLNEAYIKHEEPGPFAMFLIAFSPFLLNSFLSLVSIYLGNLQLVYHRELWKIALLYWLGASFAVHSFPSLDDVNNAYQVLTRSWISAMLGKKGILDAFLAWILFLPVFIPMLGLIGLMYIFSQIEGLGLAWFILIFLALAHFMRI